MFNFFPFGIENGIKHASKLNSFVTDRLTFIQRLMVSESVVRGHCEDAFIYIRSPEPHTDIKMASKRKAGLDSKIENQFQHQSFSSVKLK